MQKKCYRGVLKHIFYESFIWFFINIYLYNIYILIIVYYKLRVLYISRGSGLPLRSHRVELICLFNKYNDDVVRFLKYVYFTILIPGV